MPEAPVAVSTRPHPKRRRRLVAVAAGLGLTLLVAGCIAGPTSRITQSVATPASSAGKILTEPALIGLVPAVTVPVVTVPELAATADDTATNDTATADAATNDIAVEALGVQLADTPPEQVDDPVEEALGLTAGCGADNCQVRVGDGQTVLVLGDSHINIAKPVFTAWAEVNDYSLFQHSLGSCGWIRGVTRTSLGAEKVQRCLDTQFDTRAAMIDDIEPDIIVLHARVYETHPHLQTYAPDGQPSGVPIQTHIDESLSFYASSGATIMVVESLPVLEAPGADGIECLSTGAEGCDFAATPYSTNSYATGHEAVSASASFNSLVCPDQYCPSRLDGIIVRSDGNHLTPEFVEALVPAGVALLNQALV